MHPAILLALAPALSAAAVQAQMPKAPQPRRPTDHGGRPLRGLSVSRRRRILWTETDS